MRVTNRRGFLRGVAGAGLCAIAAPYGVSELKGADATPQAADAGGYISLFDGKTLTGWHKNPQKIGHGTGGSWKVQDGAIVGEQDPPGSGNGGILLTDRKFGDFELMLELKPDWPLDSGLFLRANDRGQCVQMMVDYHEGGNVGHLYGEGTGGWNVAPYHFEGEIGYGGNLTALIPRPDENFKPQYLLKTATGEQFAKAWMVDEWNTCKVRCVGKYPKVTTWINDLLVCEWDGDTFQHPQYDKEKVFGDLGREGSIAVQVHGGQRAWGRGAKCRWRNIRIKPL